jgi:hypothetical protein
VVERKHRHIVETGLTLLAHAAVPFRFWSDAFSTACFLINRTPTRVLNMKTPLELLFKELPDYTFFKVFGCACWPHLRPYNNHKLGFHYKKCVFLGYSALHKGYKCLHVLSNRVYISRDVIFDENLFPFSNMPLSSSAPPTNSTPVSPGQFDDAAYSPVLLPNHGAGTGRGARLELLDAPSAAPATPTLIHAWGIQRHRAPRHLHRLLPARLARRHPRGCPLLGRLCPLYRPRVFLLLGRCRLQAGRRARPH